MFWNPIAYLLARPAVVDWLINRAVRTPYTHIDGYMMRYWLFNPYPTKSSGRRPWWQFPISIRLHHILREDDDRHHHDHPWNARTVILRGWYREVRQHPKCLPLEESFRRLLEPTGQFFIRKAGDTAQLRFGEFHRISEVSPGGVWTLFITGRYRGDWGFDVDGVKVPHHVYLEKDRPGCYFCGGSGKYLKEHDGVENSASDGWPCAACKGSGKTL